MIVDPKSGRRLYVIEAKSVEDWPKKDPEWGSVRFGLFFAAEHIVDCKDLAWKSIDQGLALVCAWGGASPLIEEAFDEAIVRSVPDETEHNVILTTSHSHESLPEALEFFLDVIEPARDVKVEAWVIFAIGEPVWKRVRNALKRRGA